MTPSILAALILATPQPQPAFSYDKPFVYNSAGNLQKDDFLFPIVASYFSPQMTKRNASFGLTDDITLESSLLLFITGVTNMRIKMGMVNTPNFILALAPELVYTPDFDGQNQDYTILGISAPMSIKLKPGTFLTLTPGYRRSVKGVTNLSQPAAEDIIAFGINQPWIDIDYLRVIDNYSAVALQVHYTFPVGGTTLDSGTSLEPLTTITGKMEYLRAVGKSTRIGVAILYNPLWIPLDRVAPEGRPDADFLPQVSLWWRIPIGKKAVRPTKASRKAPQNTTIRRSSSTTDRLRNAPVALPIPTPAKAEPVPEQEFVPEPTPVPEQPAPAPPNPDDK